MPHVANIQKAQSLIGQLVGNGQCVSFVHHVVQIVPASLWKEGAKVRGDRTIAPGTVIATFDPNLGYGNHTDGRSHAAIYLGQDALGIHVLDQWKGHRPQPVHKRTIRFKAGHGLKCDDGDQFYVVQ